MFAHLCFCVCVFISELGIALLAKLEEVWRMTSWLPQCISPKISAKGMGTVKNEVEMDGSIVIKRLSERSFFTFKPNIKRTDEFNMGKFRMHVIGDRTDEFNDFKFEGSGRRSSGKKGEGAWKREGL